MTASFSITSLYLFLSHSLFLSLPLSLISLSLFSSTSKIIFFNRLPSLFLFHSPFLFQRVLVVLSMRFLSRRSIGPIEPRVFHRILTRVLTFAERFSLLNPPVEIGSPTGSAPMAGAYPSVSHKRQRSPPTHPSLPCRRSGTSEETTGRPRPIIPSMSPRDISHQAYTFVHNHVHDHIHTSFPPLRVATYA